MCIFLMSANCFMLLRQKRQRFTNVVILEVYAVAVGRRPHYTQSVVQFSLHSRVSLRNASQPCSVRQHSASELCCELGILLLSTLSFFPGRGLLVLPGKRSLILAF